MCVLSGNMVASILEGPIQIRTHRIVDSCKIRHLILNTGCLFKCFL